MLLLLANKHATPSIIIFVIIVIMMMEFLLAHWMVGGLRVSAQTGFGSTAPQIHRSTEPFPVEARAPESVAHGSRTKRHRQAPAPAAGVRVGGWCEGQ